MSARGNPEGVVLPDGKPNPEPPRWRQDFPVDVPQDQYVARRDFTKFMVLTSFAFTVGQFWIGVQNVIRKRRGRPPISKIAGADGLAVGASLVFDYPRPHNPCLLLRLGEDQWVAYEQKCTHLSCAVTPRLETGQLLCPCHHGFFDAASGQPTAGPPRRALARILLDVRRDGIYATGIEEPLA